MSNLMKIEIPFVIIINSIAAQLKTFSCVMPVLVMCMPVESFYASTSLKSDDSRVMIYRVVQTLVTNFQKFLSEYLFIRDKLLILN